MKCPDGCSPATSTIWTWQTEKRYRSANTEDFGKTTFDIRSGVQFESCREMLQILFLTTSLYEPIHTYNRGWWISNLHWKIPIWKPIGLPTPPNKNFDVFPNILNRIFGRYRKMGHTKLLTWQDKSKNFQEASQSSKQLKLSKFTPACQQQRSKSNIIFRKFFV
jgi:hypothetical protein